MTSTKAPAHNDTDRCDECGAHIADPHSPDCSQESYAASLDAINGRSVDWYRPGLAPCQEGTAGCAINHDRDTVGTCLVW